MPSNNLTPRVMMTKSGSMLEVVDSLYAYSVLLERGWIDLGDL